MVPVRWHALFIIMMLIVSHVNCPFVSILFQNHWQTWCGTAAIQSARLEVTKYLFEMSGNDSGLFRRMMVKGLLE